MFSTASEKGRQFVQINVVTSWSLHYPYGRIIVLVPDRSEGGSTSHPECPRHSWQLWLG